MANVTCSNEAGVTLNQGTLAFSNDTLSFRIVLGQMWSILRVFWPTSSFEREYI
jgi:hypothetical protein